MSKYFTNVLFISAIFIVAGKTTPSSSFASAVSKTPIIVGVVVAGTALILALLALFVYRTKRTQRHNLKFVRNKGASKLRYLFHDY